MAIKKILEQLTREEANEKICKIKNSKCPLEIQKWIRDYKKVGERNDYLWLWAYNNIKLVTLSSVNPKHHIFLWELKFMIVMFITLIDDVADRMKNKILLDEILKVCFEEKYIENDRLTSKEREYLEFTLKIWKNINVLVKKNPRFKEFKNIWEFDIRQTLNTMRYAYLVNKNHFLINEVEYWIYFPHNIQFVLSSTIDLMCSSKFNIYDLWRIREISWRAQRIAQAINWVTTWEREIKEKDFTSGIFAYAIKEEAIKIEDLNNGNMSLIVQKIKDKKIENQIIKECDLDYKKIKEQVSLVASVDIVKYLLGLEEYIAYQLISKGNY